MKKHHMHRRPNPHRLIVLAASLALAATAYGQYRTGSDGRANEANNRIGSGGLNQSGSTSPYASNGNRMGNDIVTGNVTGGRAFRGNIGYVAPGAFSGNVAGTNTDRFVSQSAGVPIGVYNNNNAQNVLPYYGITYNAPPPSGISSVATPSGQYLPQTPEARTAGDARLGNPFDVITVAQARPGQLVLPGPVDPTSNQQMVIAASPLFGVRPFQVGQPADDRFLQNYTDTFSGQREPKIDTNALDRMRAELAQSTPGNTLQNQPLNNSVNNNAGTQNNGNGTDTTGNGPLNNDINNRLDNNNNQNGDTNQSNNLSRTVDRSFDAPQTGALDNQPLTNSASNTNALSGDLRTNQGVRNRVLANLPRGAIANTSPQYRELQRRLNQYRTGENQIADVQANQQFQEERRALDAASKDQNNAGAPLAGNQKLKPPSEIGKAPGQPGQPNQPGAGQPGMGMGTMNASGPADANAGGPTGLNPPPANTGANTGAVTSQQPLPGVAPATPQSGIVNKPKPLQINSLAKDMKQSAAADMMRQAEADMKDQKFTRALDKFDMIEQVSPSDPLVMLGRATAELGASYYSRADAHLRDAFTKNEELLMGQYDLHTFLGDDRLRYLVTDLKDLSQRNKQDARPVFLLAYIAYNSGNESQAAAWLDLADKRSGGKDPFFKLLRTRWSLPETTGATPEPDMNK